MPLCTPHCLCTCLVSSRLSYDFVLSWPTMWRFQWQSHATHHTTNDFSKKNYRKAGQEVLSRGHKFLRDPLQKHDLVAAQRVLPENPRMQNLETVNLYSMFTEIVPPDSSHTSLSPPRNQPWRRSATFLWGSNMQQVKFLGVGTHLLASAVSFSSWLNRRSIYTICYPPVTGW